MAALAILVVIVAIAVWYVAWTFHRYDRINNRITKAEASIDVALARRYKTLTELMDVVSAYDLHEVGAISKAILMRSGMRPMEKAEASRQMDEMTYWLNIVAEHCHQIYANETYRQLRFQLQEIENSLQEASRAYNTNVSVLNHCLSRLPVGLLAGRRGYMELFDAALSERINSQEKL
jgi:LemA protein